MVERKSHEAFYRKPLRIGSAALTLALVTSMAPSFTASGLDRPWPHSRLRLHRASPRWPMSLHRTRSLMLT